MKTQPPVQSLAVVAPDTYFGGPSAISPAQAVSAAGQTSAQVALIAKLQAARAAVVGARECLAATAAGRRGKLSLKDTNMAIIDALTSPEAELDDTALSGHIRAFKQLVPTVLPEQTSALTVAQDAGAAVIMRALERYENGEVNEVWMQRMMKGLSAMSGVAVPAGNDIVKRAETLREALMEKEGEGARWVPRGHGSENRVFTGENGMVYKMCPIKEFIMDLPAITDERPLYPRSCSYPLAGASGNVPLLDRLIHAAAIPGMAMADIVGLTPQGIAIFKQADLGDREPGMHEVAEWAAANGLKALPAQEEDPRGEMSSDASILPVVGLVEGRPVLALDLNPRNTRAFNGRTIPFDIVTRELTDAEVKRHGAIRAAVEELNLERGRSLGKRPPPAAPKVGADRELGR